MEIVENEEELKEFLKQETMDEIYDFVYRRDNTITEEECDEEIAKMLEKYINIMETKEISEEDLENVGGGRGKFGMRITSAAMAALMFVPGAQTFAETVEKANIVSSGRNDSMITRLKNYVSDKWEKTKKFVITHKKACAIGLAVLIVASAGTALAIKYHKDKVAKEAAKKASMQERIDVAKEKARKANESAEKLSREIDSLKSGTTNKEVEDKNKKAKNEVERAKKLAVEAMAGATKAEEMLNSKERNKKTQEDLEKTVESAEALATTAEAKVGEATVAVRELNKAKMEAETARKAAEEAARKAKEEEAKKAAEEEASRKTEAESAISSAQVSLNGLVDATEDDERSVQGKIDEAQKALNNKKYEEAKKLAQEAANIVQRINKKIQQEKTKQKQQEFKDAQAAMDSVRVQIAGAEAINGLYIGSEKGEMGAIQRMFNEGNYTSAKSAAENLKAALKAKITGAKEEAEQRRKKEEDEEKERIAQIKSVEGKKDVLPGYKTTANKNLKEAQSLKEAIGKLSYSYSQEAISLLGKAKTKAGEAETAAQTALDNIAAADEVKQDVKELNKLLGKIVENNRKCDECITEARTLLSTAEGTERQEKEKAEQEEKLSKAKEKAKTTINGWIKSISDNIEILDGQLKSAGEQKILLTDLPGLKPKTDAEVFINGLNTDKDLVDNKLTVKDISEFLDKYREQVKITNGNLIRLDADVKTSIDAIMDQKRKAEEEEAARKAAEEEAARKAAEEAARKAAEEEAAEKEKLVRDVGERHSSCLQRYIKLNKQLADMKEKCKKVTEAAQKHGEACEKIRYFYDLVEEIRQVGESLSQLQSKSLNEMKAAYDKFNGLYLNGIREKGGVEATISAINKDIEDANAMVSTATEQRRAEAMRKEAEIARMVDEAELKAKQAREKMEAERIVKDIIERLNEEQRKRIRGDYIESQIKLVLDRYDEVENDTKFESLQAEILKNLKNKIEESEKKAAERHVAEMGKREAEAKRVRRRIHREAQADRAQGRLNTDTSKAQIEEGATTEVRDIENQTKVTVAETQAAAKEEAAAAKAAAERHDAENKAATVVARAKGEAAAREGVSDYEAGLKMRADTDATEREMVAGKKNLRRKLEREEAQRKINEGNRAVAQEEDALEQEKDLEEQQQKLEEQQQKLEAERQQREQEKKRKAKEVEEAERQEIERIKGEIQDIYGQIEGIKNELDGKNGLIGQIKGNKYDDAIRRYRSQLNRIMGDANTCYNSSETSLNGVKGLLDSIDTDLTEIKNLRGRVNSTKEQAEREAQEQAEREAKEQAERKAREQAEREALEKTNKITEAKGKFDDEYSKVEEKIRTIEEKIEGLRGKGIEVGGYSTRLITLKSSLGSHKDARDKVDQVGEIDRLLKDIRGDLSTAGYLVRDLNTAEEIENDQLASQKQTFEGIYNQIKAKNGSIAELIGNIPKVEGETNDTGGFSRRLQGLFHVAGKHKLDVDGAESSTKASEFVGLLNACLTDMKKLEQEVTTAKTNAEKKVAEKELEKKQEAERLSAVKESFEAKLGEINTMNAEISNAMMAIPIVGGINCNAFSSELQRLTRNVEVLNNQMRQETNFEGAFQKLQKIIEDSKEMEQLRNSVNNAKAEAERIQKLKVKFDELHRQIEDKLEVLTRKIAATRITGDAGDNFSEKVNSCKQAVAACMGLMNNVTTTVDASMLYGQLNEYFQAISNVEQGVSELDKEIANLVREYSSLRGKIDANSQEVRRLIGILGANRIDQNGKTLNDDFNEGMVKIDDCYSKMRGVKTTGDIRAILNQLGKLSEGLIGLKERLKQDVLNEQLQKQQLQQQQQLQQKKNSLETRFKELSKKFGKIYEEIKNKTGKISSIFENLPSNKKEEYSHLVQLANNRAEIVRGQKNAIDTMIKNGKVVVEKRINIFEKSINSLNSYLKKLEKLDTSISNPAASVEDETTSKRVEKSEFTRESLKQQEEKEEEMSDTESAPKSEQSSSKKRRILTPEELKQEEITKLEQKLSKLSKEYESLSDRIRKLKTLKTDENRKERRDELRSIKARMDKINKAKSALENLLKMFQTPNQ